MDLIVRNTRLSCDPVAPPVDIGVQAGRIVAIEPNLAADARETWDAGGCMACAGFCETHIHLEKSRLTGRCGQPDGRDANAVPRISAIKPEITVEDVVARASATLEDCLKNGTTRMRAHVELDPRIGLRGFEGVKQLARAYAWAIDIEICVFPQEGLTNNPGTDELLVAALRDGATVIGAAPNFDPDPAAQIDRVFALAREFDVDIDMHLDSGNSAEHLDLYQVCRLTEQHKLGGRVAVGHASKLSTMQLPDLKRMAQMIADAGVAVTVLPATDLFMTGRDQTDNIRRGVADVTLLAAHGVNCSLSTNNVLNPFTPYGDCSLVRMGNLQANICQIEAEAELADIFAMLTERSARLMNLRDYGLKIGNPADIVVIDATSPAQAIAEIRPPLAAFKRGRRTLTRPRPELHRPQA